MSENIRGITFAEQAITPADDAIVRRTMLGDGMLSGCEISYSGSTLTMAAGYMIVCGRSFQITNAQNWAVVDATSGFARLVLTIDLTKTATENAFNQIDFAVEYASAEDGFTDLVQENINISGTKYQLVVAVVSLGTGGITGIISNLERMGILRFFPVGAIYLSANSTSPAALFGGTWEQLKDRFLLGAGDIYAAGSTGGEATHKLTIDEMPSHRHQVKRSQGTGSGSRSNALQTVESTYYTEDSAYGALPNGGNREHNNMPPYLSAYMWKRIA